MIVFYLHIINVERLWMTQGNPGIFGIIWYGILQRMGVIWRILMMQHFSINLVKVFSWTDFVPLWRQVTSSGVGVKSQKLLVRIVIAINHSSILKYSIAYTAVWFFLWFNLVFLASTQGQPRELELNKQWMELDSA